MVEKQNWEDVVEGVVAAESSASGATRICPRTSSAEWACGMRASISALLEVSASMIMPVNVMHRDSRVVAGSRRRSSGLNPNRGAIEDRGPPLLPDLQDSKKVKAKPFERKGRVTSDLLSIAVKMFANMYSMTPEAKEGSSCVASVRNAPARKVWHVYLTTAWLGVKATHSGRRTRSLVRSGVGGNCHSSLIPLQGERTNPTLRALMSSLSVAGSAKVGTIPSVAGALLLLRRESSS